jgi:outer membrane protein assembly factor BamB
MAALKYFPDLRVLWMTGTSITDAGFMQIAGLKKLERIWFGDTKITDVGMKVFTQLSELTDVSFYRIKVSDAGMQYLSNCKKLDNIHASDVPITDKAIGYWVDLPKLESLSLESTKITDKALSSFKKMPALDTLDVEKTAFSYTAYSQLKNFKKSKAKPVMEHADIVSAPAIFSKCVVLLLESGEVVCLDRSLGKQLWKRKADKADSIVNVKNMLVHINVFPRLAVTALRPDGTVLWSYAGPQAFSSRRVSGGFDSSRLFLFSGEGRVISLDLKNGHLLWDKTIKNTTLCRRVGSFVGREEYLLEQDSKMLYLRGVFGNGSGYGKADTRLLAVEKETGNLAWRSQNVFSESLAVQVFSLAKSGCLLLLSNSDKAQADLFVLDIPTGRLLTQDSLRCRSLSVYDRCPSSEFVMDKMQSSGFYLEPIWGSICKIGSIHIERIKDRAQIVRDQVKYWSWDYLILRDLTDLGLFIGTREGTLLLNPKVLKPICMLPRGHYDNIETIICAEKVQNTAQLVATVYHSKQEHWCKYYSVAEIVALEIPTGKRLWTVRTGVTNVDKSIYDATTNQLFVYDYVKPLSCWNTSTGKKIWMYQTPLIPAKPSYGCGNLYRDSLVR